MVVNHPALPHVLPTTSRFEALGGLKAGDLETPKVHCSAPGYLQLKLAPLSSTSLCLVVPYLASCLLGSQTALHGKNNHTVALKARWSSTVRTRQAILSSRVYPRGPIRTSKYSQVQCDSFSWSGAPEHECHLMQPFTQPRQSGRRHSLTQAEVKPRCRHPSPHNR